MRHSGIHLIAFTGSREVGLDILRAAYSAQPGQQHVKRVICEMGGKNALIVDKDADLDEALTYIVESAFGYQGQKCSAASRLILLEAIHDLVLERLVEATRISRSGRRKIRAISSVPSSMLQRIRRSWTISLSPNARANACSSSRHPLTGSSSVLRSSAGLSRTIVSQLKKFLARCWQCSKPKISTTRSASPTIPPML